MNCKNAKKYRVTRSDYQNILLISNQHFFTTRSRGDFFGMIKGEERDKPATRKPTTCGKDSATADRMPQNGGDHSAMAETLSQNCGNHSATAETLSQKGDNPSATADAYFSTHNYSKGMHGCHFNDSHPLPCHGMQPF